MIGAAGLAIPVTLPMPLQLKTRFRDDYQVEAGGEQVRIFFELRTSCAASSCLKSGVLGKSPWPNGRGGKLLKFPFHGNAHERAVSSREWIDSLRRRDLGGLLRLLESS
jgi:hypothetical protein